MPAVDPSARPFVVHAGEGLDAPLGSLGVVHKVPSMVTGGQLGIVEHTLPPRTLAAPLHRHRDEDELSIVLAGEIGALLGDDVAVAGPGSYVWKPRGQWHTFWNAGDVELRFIELIVPGGFEGYFELLATRLTDPAEADVAELRTAAARYGLEVAGSTVPGLCERFGLAFG